MTVGNMKISKERAGISYYICYKQGNNRYKYRMNRLDCFDKNIFKNIGINTDVNINITIDLTVVLNKY